MLGAHLVFVFKSDPVVLLRRGHEGDLANCPARVKVVRDDRALHLLVPEARQALDRHPVRVVEIRVVLLGRGCERDLQRVRLGSRPRFLDLLGIVGLGLFALVRSRGLGLLLVGLGLLLVSLGLLLVGLGLLLVGLGLLLVGLGLLLLSRLLAVGRLLARSLRLL